MSKIQKIKMSLQRMLMNFGDVTTDKGVLEYTGEELEVGTEVFVEDAPAPDGEYETETQVIVVAEGKVVEIREKEVATPEEEAPAEEVIEAEEEVVPEEVIPEEPSLEDSLVDILRPITDELNAVKAEVEAVKARLAEIESKLLEDSAKPADEEFKSVKKNSGFFRN